MKRDLDKIILTRQELRLMKIIWEMGAASGKSVYAVIAKKKKTAYTTVLTTLGILESKGALTHTKSGRAFIYKPLLTRKQATRNQICDVLDRFFDGNPQKLIENIQENATKPYDMKSQSNRQEMEATL
ncbi:MAG: BlaI/MecI/CopY family transcriptional regulator [Acidobacteria bacterium]|nr:BlaI/MecI/CopY family transcriptional regulator [Acidobacteriota bacterium]